MTEPSTSPDSDSGPAVVKLPGAIRATLSSTSFVEKFLLLLLTAALSGAAVPWINARLQQAATTSQKEVDQARLQRAALIEAQRALFNEFSEVALTYQTLALDVSWYKTADASDQRLFDKALARYADKTPDLISQWRVLASRASVLGSPVTAARMSDLLEQVFREQDTPLSRLVSKGGDVATWEEQHKRSERMLGVANNSVMAIATDMGLAAGNESPEK